MIKIILAVFIIFHSCHSAICLGNDYVDNYSIPSAAQIPAKFEKGEVVCFKDNNTGETIYKTTIGSTEMFVVGLQRTYLNFAK